MTYIERKEEDLGRLNAETRKKERKNERGKRLIKHFANFGKLYIHQSERRRNCLRQILSNAGASARVTETEYVEDHRSWPSGGIPSSIKSFTAHAGNRERGHE